MGAPGNFHIKSCRFVFVRAGFRLLRQRRSSLRPLLLSEILLSQYELLYVPRGKTLLDLLGCELIELGEELVAVDARTSISGL